MGLQTTERTLEPVQTFIGSEGPVTSLCSVSSGSLAGHIISGSSFAAVYVWDVEKRKRLTCKFRCDNRAPKNTTVFWTHPDERDTAELFVHLRDGVCGVWKIIPSGAQALRNCKLNDQFGFCPGSAFDAQRTVCVPAGQIGNNNSGFVLLSQDTLEPVGAFIPSVDHSVPVRTCRYRDHELFVVYEDATVALWDVRSQNTPVFESDVFRKHPTMSSEDLGVPMALDVDATSGIGLLGTSSSLLQRFDILPAELTLKDSIRMPEEGVSDVRIRSDGKICTVASWDYTARVYSWKSLKPLVTLDMHRDTIQRVDYGIFDGKNCLVLGGKDELLTVWPLY
ncbi:guanine nucleotide-binding protein subunit beta-like protein 1 [Paramacrobiotus metropolitanus]|uniref:guanine nucleotide-binding protein subunit beta-like protein 1 n=1 Tax=Paramacrobiotus metropolitanus TaxID=2943436 RepID=UPI0024463C8F|nr:guanine nucleotide-binding protein subunit beta-like protein 1 [Paramacrobiotus metropolitanus]